MRVLESSVVSRLFFLIIPMSSLAVNSLKLADFASLPFVKQALATPKSSKSVLSYFFGVDYSNPTEVDEKMRQGKSLFQMQDLWYKGGPDYDALCQPFGDTVRAAGKGELDGWNGSVDGVVARMILCDQLARNVFRGTPEAFAYDATALASVRSLFQAFSSSKSSNTESPLEGEFYPPYLSFMITAFMHSETLEDHEECLELLAMVKEHCNEDELMAQWNYQEQFAKDHKDVIERFGRYPHRNSLHGRDCTPEEDAWLSDRDNLPIWALSQLPASDSKQT